MTFLPLLFALSSILPHLILDDLSIFAAAILATVVFVGLPLLILSNSVLPGLTSRHSILYPRMLPFSHHQA